MINKINIICMNIIIGVYDGYDIIKTKKGGLIFFLKSLRKYNKVCKVVVICKNVFNEMEKICLEYDCDIYSDFNLEYRMMDYRFIISKKILIEYNDKFNIGKILLSDISDVVFQSDPFEIEFKEGIYCALEKTILGESSLGLKNLEKTKIMNININYDFLQNNVINAGTILGYYDYIIHFLEYYEEMQNMSKYKNKFKFNNQILLNIYVENFCDSIKKINYKKSQILTLSSILFSELKQNNNKIVNDDNIPYSIIHHNGDYNIEFMNWCNSFLDSITIHTKS